MDLPVFIDLECSSPDEDAFPVAISWSLRDGAIKSVIIMPDDDWSPWDNSASDIDLDHLFDQGVSGPDIIRELNDDLSGQTVFFDGLDEDALLLEKLYETYKEEPAFEVSVLSTLTTDYDFETLLDIRRDIAEQQQLDLNDSEDNVRSLVFLAESIS